MTITFASFQSKNSPSPCHGEGAGGWGQITLAALTDLSLALALGVFDEVYSPVQRLAIITAIDVWVLTQAGSQDAAMLTTLAHFWAHIQAGDYPSAYAEAIAAQRIQV